LIAETPTTKKQQPKQGLHTEESARAREENEQTRVPRTTLTGMKERLIPNHIKVSFNNGFFRKNAVYDHRLSLDSG
jgi:hypothetical protein